MPIHRLGAQTEPVSTPTGGIRRLAPTGDSTPDTPIDLQQDEQGGSWALPALGAAAVGGLAYAATRNPEAAKELAGKAVRGLQDVRIGSMLSGMAPVKSALGNLGSSVYASIEHGSLAPLRSMLSGETLADIIANYKNGAVSANLGAPATVISRYNPITRIMSATDEAAKAALVRSGVMHDPAEVSQLVSQGLPYQEAMRKSAGRAAEKAMLQAPIPEAWKSASEGPVAQYLVPFRRTPFNQLMEGLNATNPQTAGQAAALGTSVATGAATGYTAEDPRTVALGTAASGRYGLPFAAGAAWGRYARTGNARKAADVLQGISPVSDYSLQEAILEPTRVIPKPAAVSAYGYLRSLLGLE